MDTGMIRVTIYVNKHDWQGVQKKAWELSKFDKRVSVGSYLMSLHNKNNDNKGNNASKVNTPSVPMDIGLAEKPEKAESSFHGGRDKDATSEIKKEVAVKLDKVRKKKGSKERPAFGYPKSHQTR